MVPKVPPQMMAKRNILPRQELKHERPVSKWSSLSSSGCGSARFEQGCKINVSIFGRNVGGIENLIHITIGRIHDEHRQDIIPIDFYVGHCPLP